ncbi:hypothetical protein COY23_04280 [bacterium (Candidatus Torokbacteria) CG_4_10_14_0_2_um_filter_35_8]|nr:MAG: hypothetical protein COY23_04280 [bacterium (Candidatus Torokbacteria) CG_4_10_14_0_2_um_filter_35_8]
MRNKKEKIEKILQNLKKGYQSRYQTVIFDVDVIEKSDSELVLKGEVLLPKQKKDIIERLQGFSFQEQIKVLSNPKAKPIFGWGRVGRLTNIYRDPFQKEFTAQIVSSDIPFKIIHKKGNSYLIELWDLTLGWIEEKDIIKVETKNYWKGLKIAKKDRIAGSEASRDDIIKRAKSYLKVPYLWGGASREGIDCSDFVQRVYWEEAEIILPKHTLDQMKVGIQIDLENAKSGDLIFLRNKETKGRHVGIYVGENKVIHSFRKERKVVISNLGKLLEDYNLISVNQIVNVKT